MYIWVLVTTLRMDARYAMGYFLPHQRLPLKDASELLSPLSPGVVSVAKVGKARDYVAKCA